MRISLIIICSLLFSLTSQGAETADTVSVPKRNFWSHGFGKFLKNVDGMVKSWEYAGIDTNYIAVPEKDRMIYLGGYSYWSHHRMELPILLESYDLPTGISHYMPENFDEKRYVNTRMYTSQHEIELGIDWRGISIELPISLWNHFSKSYGLAKNGSVWGARIRYKVQKRMTGTIDNAFKQMTLRMANDYIADVQNISSNVITEDMLTDDHSPIETTTQDIEEDNLELRNFYLEGYYVFNHKKFCLAAGMYGDMIQKRSAGGAFVMANYYQSRLAFSNTLLNNDYDTFRNNKFSVGAGYGYNWAFYDGRLCLHLSAIPMFSFINRVTHKGYNNPDPEPTSEEMAAYYKTLRQWTAAWDNHYYDAADKDRDSYITVNGFARAAINYSWDRYIVSFLANYRQYLFNNSCHLYISNREWDIQLNFGYRF